MGWNSRNASIHFGNGDPPSGPPGNGEGPPDDHRRDILLAQLRAARTEFQAVERSHEVRTAIVGAKSGVEAAAGNFLVDAVIHPEIGASLLETGTSGMGLSHILGRHLVDFQNKGIGNNPQDVVDYLIHTVRTGTCVEARPASGGSGATYTFESNWRYRQPRCLVTINAQGEIVQANPL
jgi:hypothetical protein